MEYLPTPALLGFMTYAYAVNLFTFAVLGYAAPRPRRRRVPSAGRAAARRRCRTDDRRRHRDLGADRPRFVDLTPVTFAATSGLLGWVVFRYRLLDLSPIARDAVFANLSDGIVVVDDAGRVVDLNRPARRLFPSAAIGCGVDEAFERAPAVTDLVSRDGTVDGAGSRGTPERTRTTISG